MISKLTEQHREAAQAAIARSMNTQDNYPLDRLIVNVAQAIADASPPERAKERAKATYSRYQCKNCEAVFDKRHGDCPVCGCTNVNRTARSSIRREKQGKRKVSRRSPTSISSISLAISSVSSQMLLQNMYNKQS